MVSVAASDDGSAASVVVQPPLSQAVGYIVVVLIGFLIAFIMVFITRVLKKTVGEDNEKTEMFMTANRSVTTGLTASAVVSSWLWSTAMLGSSLVGYVNGISGPFWFAAGCSPMIVFFAVLGMACKRKIPEAHTLLEIIRIRYGNAAHIVYMALCLINNLVAVANMILGASAAISALTGMHIIAATFLLPVGVALYTFVGGIKATFLTDYFHTFVILIILCYFSVKAFTIPEVSSLGHLFDLVKAAGERNPVAGNEQGSFLTMTSTGGIYFGILHICANFGLVIMDTSFFQKSFSASPKAVVPGYVIGGIAYFAIPWFIGTLASSVVLGLEDNPIFPTYPRRMSATEVSNGLVLPYFAMTIAGTGGAVGMLLITFMAVTSTLSAQIIAVSSIISFDIYRTYIKPTAGDKDIIKWCHIGVIFFALFASAFSTLLHYVGIDLGWTLYMLGVLTCPGIFPTTFAILWKKQSRAAAIISPLLGMATGIAVWLGSAYALYGAVTIASTGMILPCVYGTVASAFAPLPYSLIITLIKPEKFDWANFRNEKLALDLPSSDETDGQTIATVASNSENGVLKAEMATSDLSNQPHLKRWARIASAWALATFLGHWVLWPLPMYAAKYIFSKGFFAAWLVVGAIWLWITLLIVGFYPIIDGREQILDVWRALRKDRAAKKNASTTNSGAASIEGESGSGTGTETPSVVEEKVI
ncbi:Sodium:solute symporter family-domain-containing protein [Rhypophila decipiens]|uniref:Sodium:solute symporter family-domain-containing protein n=1 Tax=Rhypophila decipiens TaxID=261697 RepID=A0AAN6Y9Q2_9PEZI|nr:Sodium:solute symporter family-domain-containing protein [Rhypophila decipiens]